MLSWDRSALLSTGLKLDGDLAVIDVDVSEAGLVDALADALDARFPELFAHGLVRHAGGPKEAWIARVDEPFRRLASRRWYRGSDPDDPAVPKHHGRMLRLARDAAVRDRRAACARPPRRGDRAPTSSPAAPRRRRRRGRRCRCCRRRPTRWPATCSMRSPRRRGSPPSRRPARPRRRARCFELDADTVIETQRPRRDDGRRARALHARAPGARKCAGDVALLGHASTIRRGCGPIRISSTGAATASASTTP